MKQTLLLLSGILLLSACEKPASIPAYLHVDEFLFNGMSGEGTADQKITDVWVYVDGDFRGAFEMPCEVPILEEGEVNLRLEPGIKMNGISNTRLAFPYFEDFEMQALLVKDEILSVSAPFTSYTDLTEFTWIEDFEDPGFSLEESNKSDTTFFIVDDTLAFEGNNSVAFHLDANHTFFEGISTEEWPLETTVGHIYFLEMNYKSDHPFTVGIFANNSSSVSQEQILRINPSKEWNKIYVNLTPNILSHFNASGFKVFFGATLLDSTQATVYLDNLKLISL